MTIVAQQFNVRSEKILFLAMAMLRFAAKYPRKVGDNGIPVPWRTGFALFGPLTVAKTIRSLRRLTTWLSRRARCRAAGE